MGSASGQEHTLWSQTACVQIPALPPTSYLMDPGASHLTVECLHVPISKVRITIELLTHNKNSQCLAHPKWVTNVSYCRHLRPPMTVDWGQRGIERCTKNKHLAHCGHPVHVSPRWTRDIPREPCMLQVHEGALLREACTGPAEAQGAHPTLGLLCKGLEGAQASLGSELPWQEWRGGPRTLPSPHAASSPPEFPLPQTHSLPPHGLPQTRA